MYYNRNQELYWICRFCFLKRLILLVLIDFIHLLMLLIFVLSSFWHRKLCPRKLHFTQISIYSISMLNVFIFTLYVSNLVFIFNTFTEILFYAMGCYFYNCIKMFIQEKREWCLLLFGDRVGGGVSILVFLKGGEGARNWWGAGNW